LSSQKARGLTEILLGNADHLSPKGLVLNPFCFGKKVINIHKKDANKRIDCGHLAL
jgi:hypothetical protein